MISSTGWQYMGPGGGDYAAGAANYTYVGYGAGSFAKEMVVTPYGCKLRPCCIALSLLACLLPLLFMFFRPPKVRPPDVVPQVPDVTTPRPVGPFLSCIVFGDPHVKSFDNQRSDYYTPGEYWLVKSAAVWIQARYLPTRATSGLGVTKILAIGGPFLKGHKLFVSATWATWDGQPILQGFPSSFSAPGLVQMHYDSQGALMQNGRGGLDKHVVHIKLEDGSPEGIQIQVNRWTRASEGNYINVRISMHAQPGQDGHCGNFNGNPADDERIQVRARVGKTGVNPGELLFRSKTPVVQGNRPNINDAPAEKLESCKSLCKAKEHKFIPSMACLIDCCFGGKGFAEEG